MLYLHLELLQWLKSHDLISIAKLENKAGIPKDTLRHFIKERRDISPLQYESVKDVLLPYGFSPQENGDILAVDKIKPVEY